MVLLYRLLEILLKLLVLFIIISFERVVGYPVLFITVTMSFMLTARSISKYIIFFLSAWMLTVFYQQLLIVSLLVFFIFYFGFKFLNLVIESNLQRFILFLFLSLLIISFGSNIIPTLLIVIHLMISLLISIVFLVKVLFVQYGFFGNKLTTKQSFLR